MQCASSIASVEELHPPRLELALDFAAVRTALAAREHPRRDAVGAESVDLVLHQGDQGTDDDRQARADQRRSLVAQALSAAGRHDEERVAALERRADRPVLKGAQALEPEGPAHELEDAGEGIAGGGDRLRDG